MICPPIAIIFKMMCVCPIMPSNVLNLVFEQICLSPEFGDYKEEP